MALAVRAWCLWAGSVAMARSSLPRLLIIGGRLQAGAVRLLAACSHLPEGADIEHATGIGLNLGKLWALERLLALRHWNTDERFPSSPADEAEQALFAAMCHREAQVSADAALGLVAVMSMSQAVRLTLDAFIKAQRARVLDVLAGAERMRNVAVAAGQATCHGVPVRTSDEASGIVLRCMGQEDVHVS